MANLKSIDFENANDNYALANDSSSFDFSTLDTLSCEMWFKPESLPEGPAFLVGKSYATGTTCGWYWLMNDASVNAWHGQFVAYGLNTGGAYNQQTTDGHILTDADIGTWVHLAVTYDAPSKSIIFYKNGDVVASTATNGGGGVTVIPSNTTKVSIGTSDETVTTSVIDGLIDEIRVWNDVRTGDEIADNMSTEIAVDSAGLVAYYKFSSNGNDSTANGNNLTLYNSPTYSTDVPFDPAIATTVTTQPVTPITVTTFVANGNITNIGSDNATRRGFCYAEGSLNSYSLDLEASSSQYASIADASQTGLDITGDMTIEAWLKLETGSGDNMGIVSKWLNTGNQRSFKLRFDDAGNALQLKISTDGTDAGTIGGPSVAFNPTPGTWYHIAMTYNSATGAGILYVNGSSVGTSTDGSGGAYNGTGSFNIGSNFTTTAVEFWDGLIDEVRIWSDIRTATEISENYNKQLNGDEANLVGYWRFNNDYLDQTSNNNDLTASGSPVFSTSVGFGSAPTTSDSVSYDDGSFSTGAYTKTIIRT